VASKFLNRDSGFDGKVFHGCMPTGIHCRFTCLVAKPNRSQVSFFSLSQAAEDQGPVPASDSQKQLLQTPRDKVLAVAILKHKCDWSTLVELS